MTGSHIDTVRTGGRYDGNLGVLAGSRGGRDPANRGRPLTPARTRSRSPSSPTRRAPASRPTCSAVAGVRGRHAPRGGARRSKGIDGAVVGPRAGADRLPRTLPPCPGPVPHAFVELHVEQGPVLEAEGVTIGAVDRACRASAGPRLTITGQSNHAGTTPDARFARDPGLVAVPAWGHVRQTTWPTSSAAPQVATVGRDRSAPQPGQRGAGLGHVMTVDLRNTDDDGLLQQAERRTAVFLDYCDELAAAENVHHPGSVSLAQIRAGRPSTPRSITSGRGGRHAELRACP